MSRIESIGLIRSPGCPASLNEASEVGLERLFPFKRGSVGALRYEADPDGMHSWVEADGWALNASNGGAGAPVYLSPVESQRDALRLTGVHDIEYELEMEPAN